MQWSLGCDNHRAIASIFETLSAKKREAAGGRRSEQRDEDAPSEWVVTVSFLQIYQETIQDLLSPWTLEVRQQLTGQEEEGRGKGKGKLLVQ